MPEDRTTEELVELAKEIRRRVSEKVREAVGKNVDIKLSADLPDRKSVV